MRERVLPNLSITELVPYTMARQGKYKGQSRLRIQLCNAARVANGIARGGPVGCLLDQATPCQESCDARTPSYPGGLGDSNPGPHCGTRLGGDPPAAEAARHRRNLLAPVEPPAAEDPGRPQTAAIPEALEGRTDLLVVRQLASLGGPLGPRHRDLQRVLPRGVPDDYTGPVMKPVLVIGASSCKVRLAVAHGGVADDNLHVGIAAHADCD